MFDVGCWMLDVLLPPSPQLIPPSPDVPLLRAGATNHGEHGRPRPSCAASRRAHSREASPLDVRCWMLDVGCSSPPVSTVDPTLSRCPAIKSGGNESRGARASPAVVRGVSPRTFSRSEPIGCSMLDVGCWMFFSPRLHS